MKKVVELKPLPGYRLQVRFDDGVEGTVNLSAKVGVGVFALWTDPEAFTHVRIGEFGGPVWSDEVDLCPDMLWLEVTGRAPAELYPSLKGEPVHA